jgi:hypothetical protein
MNDSQTNAVGPTRPGREIKHHPTERYPSEIEWTSAGTWIIPDLHLGRWTSRTPGPDESPAQQSATGGRISPDALNFDVIGQAQTLGWPTPPNIVGFLEDCGAQLEDAPLAGVNAHLANDHVSERLKEVAQKAVAWLNEFIAPNGRRFVLEDALYLIEDDILR